MTDTIDLTIPTERLAEWAVATARELGTLTEHVSVPRDAADEYEIEWPEPSDYDVDRDGPLTYQITAESVAKTSRKVAMQTRHHPAEYETVTVDVQVNLFVDLENPPEAFVWGDVTGEIHNL